MFKNIANILFQGTIALEFLEQVPDLDAVLVPVSGGGMISGIAIAAKNRKDDVKGKVGVKGLHTIFFQKVLEFWN